MGCLIRAQKDFNCNHDAASSPVYPLSYPVADQESSSICHACVTQFYTPDGDCCDRDNSSLAERFGMMPNVILHESSDEIVAVIVSLLHA